MRVAGLAAVLALIADMACAQAPMAGANDARRQAAPDARWSDAKFARFFTD